MKKVSGYSTWALSDLKASKVGANTVLAGRRFHSRTVPGKKEFDSIWSLIRSWNDLCCPLVSASPLWRNFVCVDVYTIVADLVHHGEPAVFSTLFKGICWDFWVCIPLPQFEKMFWKFEQLRKLKINRLPNGAFCLNLKRCKMRRRFIIIELSCSMSFSRDFFVSYTILCFENDIP